MEDYAGIEATKTGYVCASGFNVAVSAVHGNKRVIGVVLGASSAAVRTRIIKELLDAGFAGATSSIGNLRMVRANAPAPGADLRRLKCGRQNPAVAETRTAGGEWTPKAVLQRRR